MSGNKANENDDGPNQVNPAANILVRLDWEFLHCFFGTNMRPG